MYTYFPSLSRLFNCLLNRKMLLIFKEYCLLNVVHFIKQHITKNKAEAYLYTQLYMYTCMYMQNTLYFYIINKNILLVIP